MYGFGEFFQFMRNIYFMTRKHEEKFPELHTDFL